MAITYLDDEPKTKSSKIQYLDEPQKGASPIGAMATGAAALGGVGYGVYRARKALAAPGLEVRPIESELRKIASGIGQPMAYSEDVPSLIQDKIKSQSMQNKPVKVSDINRDTRFNINQAKRKLSSFDDNYVSKISDDLATNIKTNYPEFTNSLYKFYGEGLKKAESILESSGQRIKAVELKENVLQKGLKLAQEEGVLPKDLKRIESLIKQVSGDEIPFKQAKGLVSNLTKELPKSAQHKITESWGDFLETKSNGEVRKLLTDINTKYKYSAEARNALFKLIKKDTGEFDVKALSGRIKQYVKTGNDSGLSSLLEALSEGTDAAKPISGLGNKITILNDIINQRSSIKNIIPATEKAGKLAVNAALRRNLAIENAKNSLVELEQKASSLLSQRKHILTEKYPIRGKIPSLIRGGVQGAIARKIAGGLLHGAATGVIEGKIMEGAFGANPYDLLNKYIQSKFGTKEQKQQIEKEAEEQFKKYIAQQMI